MFRHDVARVTKVVVAEVPELSRIFISDEELDGVKSFTIHQEAGALPVLVLQLELRGVEIVRK